MSCILIHGLGQTTDAWDQTIAELDDNHNYHPVNLSEFYQQDTTYQSVYQGFTDKYWNQEPQDICGLSLGAVIALNYAIDYPDKVNKLILIAPQYRMPKKLLYIQNIIFRILPNQMFKKMNLTKKQVLSLTSSMRSIDFSNKLSKVKCETLIICGAGDRPNLKASNSLKAKLDNCMFVTIPNSKHEVNIDNPQELAKVINKFLG